jgi:hypothetical protein
MPRSGTGQPDAVRPDRRSKAEHGRPRRGIIEALLDPPKDDRLVPPIDQLTRIEPAHLARLDRHGIFTTGLLLEVSETPTRRQTLADQVVADTTDVLTWRDEALMLNLASFGPGEHLLDLDLDAFRVRVVRAAGELGVDPPTDLTIEGWWDQARTLEDE